MSDSGLIVCPISGEKLMPAKVWESRLPNGQAVRYGQFRPHSHWGQECDWSHLVQPLLEEQPGFPF